MMTTLADRHKRRRGKAPPAIELAIGSSSDAKGRVLRPMVREPPTREVLYLWGGCEGSSRRWEGPAVRAGLGPLCMWRKAPLGYGVSGTSNSRTQGPS